MTAMKIEHIGLWVKDLELMKAFYLKYFDASSSDFYHNPKTGFSSYFIYFSDGASLELQHKASLNARNNETFGFAHLAFKITDVDEMVARVKKDGLPVLNGPRWTGDGHYEAVIADPEGNLLELTL